MQIELLSRVGAGSVRLRQAVCHGPWIGYWLAASCVGDEITEVLLLLHFAHHALTVGNGGSTEPPACLSSP
jgi:hypothetical protein